MQRRSLSSMQAPKTMQYPINAIFRFQCNIKIPMQMQCKPYMTLADHTRIEKLGYSNHMWSLGFANDSCIRWCLGTKLVDETNRLHMSCAGAGGARQAPVFPPQTSPRRRIHDHANSNYSQPARLELKSMHRQIRQNDLSISMLTIPTRFGSIPLDRVSRHPNTYE